jgi:hypothetical protein
LRQASVFTRPKHGQQRRRHDVVGLAIEVFDGAEEERAVPHQRTACGPAERPLLEAGLVDGRNGQLC